VDSAFLVPSQECFVKAIAKVSDRAILTPQFACLRKHATGQFILPGQDSATKVMNIGKYGSLTLLTAHKSALTPTADFIPDESTL
jgi:hypothetical protein